MSLDLHPRFQAAIFSATGASALKVTKVIQQLWSGYGQILRIKLEGGSETSVIAKMIQMTAKGKHPRGWNSDLSHQRKLKSYQVETTWYRNWSERCGEG